MFVTVDFEIADRLLPSICSIAIITWDNKKIVDSFFSYIKPDCEVEDFFHDRHGISDELLMNAPTLSEQWITIYDLLENKTVFFFNPNQSLKTLIERTQVDQLNLPNMNYGSVQSICKRTWKGMKEYLLPSIEEELDISTVHHNALEDATNLGKIIYKASDHLGLDSPYDLFKEIGFSGGYIRNNKKIPYRAIKNKKKNIFETKEWEYKRKGTTQ